MRFTLTQHKSGKFTNRPIQKIGTIGLLHQIEFSEMDKQSAFYLRFTVAPDGQQDQKAFLNGPKGWRNFKQGLRNWTVA